MILKSLLSGQRAAIWYVLLVICLPLLTLIGVGLWHLWQNRWLITVTLAWLAVTLVGYAVYRLWPERRKPLTTEQDAPPADSTSNIDSGVLENLPVRLDARPDWTSLDLSVWHRSVESIESILALKPSWKELPEQALALLTDIADQYDSKHSKSRDRNLPFELNTPNGKQSGATYRFTLPEMLLVMSITSSRYRQLLLSHVPFAERIRISAILTLYARQDQIRTGAGWINTVRRTARLVNPLAAVAAELRDQFTNRIFTNLSDKVQNDLKRLLLQELVQVGMDLYSGRLKSSDAELLNFQSRLHADDLSARAVSVEPLRVVLLGQVSAGKSSLVNALVDTLEAETDILPTTDRTTVHALHLPAGSSESSDDGMKNQTADSSSHDVHLIDTVGLVDDAASVQASLNSVQHADLLIWVTRATQPARAPEAEVYKALMQTFIDQPSWRPPPMLLAITHVDQLSPKAQWQPPYDLNSTERKAQNIKRAIDSCRQQIGLPEQTPGIPIVMAKQYAPYNIDALVAQILSCQQEAALVQLNRRRIERDKNSGGWQDRWEQASKLGTVTGKILTRSVIGK